MLSYLFDSSFMPHGHCYHWRSDILWMHVGSDVAIALAYFSIPVTLFYLMRRRPDVPYRWVLALFAAFIAMCACTHLMGVWTIWNPSYVIEGYLKAATALISVITAVSILPLLPRLMQMKTPEELEAANASLQKEITQRISAEKGLESAVASLKSTNDELQRFAYVVSHDLQAPLRSISSFTDLLEEQLGDQSTEEQTQSMHYIQNGTRHMKRLLQDVLKLSMVDSQGEDFGAIDLTELLAEVKAQLHADLQDAGAEVNVIGNLDTVFGDRSQLHQLLQNLVGNAIKFQVPGRPPRVDIIANDLGEQIEIVVRDNGIGIPEHKCEEVFGVFSRLHTQDSYEGTGIGLSICKKIVQRHDGDIRAESKPGEGSQFIFTLPKPKPAEDS